MDKIYFPNLNALRFIAAFAVFIHHIEQFKNIHGYSNYWHLNRIQSIGKLGVVLFFVLSGFLITYLLLTEKKSKKTINVNAFYIRRVLRIWPLYFLVFFASFFILPNLEFFSLDIWSNNLHNDFSIKFLLYLFFLPHVALAFYTPIPYASQLWSIGVEEYFYILWAPLIKIFRNTLNLLLGIIGFYLGLKTGLKILEWILPGFPYLTEVRNTLSLFNINCMAIGGLFAYTYFKKNKIFSFFSKQLIFFVALSLLTICLLIGFKMPYLNFEFYSILYGIIILNLATNTMFKNSLEKKSLNYLGKISYGIYMFHPICIVVGLKLLKYLNLQFSYLQYIVCFILTILISALSYQFLEKWFLNKKENFKILDSY